MTTNVNNTATDRFPRPSKISQAKLYEYIKKVELDGYPRIRAYAETIDPEIYKLEPSKAIDRLDSLKERRADYDDVKAMVLAEQEDWILRRSSVIQDKAVNLLANLIDKANELATKPDADVKELNTAVSTLKTIMPAFTNINNSKAPTDTTDRKARAAGFINVLVCTTIGAWILQMISIMLI